MLVPRRFALVERDVNRAMREAHALLDVADANGYVFLMLDALELIAECCDGHGLTHVPRNSPAPPPPSANAIGCLGRFRGVALADGAMVARLAEAEPEAFAAGSALTVADAVELARRGTRRARPAGARVGQPDAHRTPGGGPRRRRDGQR